MLETLTILPMVPGTRTRRADHHRPTPVLLPKRTLQQTTLDHWQHRLTGQQAPNAPAPKQQQHKQTPPLKPPKPANTPNPPANSPNSPLANAAPTRSIQDILNHADPMRPKRKSDAIDAPTKPELPADSTARKRPRLAVELFAKPTPVLQGRAENVPRPATRVSTGAVAASVGTAKTTDTAHAPPKQALRATPATAKATAAPSTSAPATASHSASSPTTASPAAPVSQPSATPAAPLSSRPAATRQTASTHLPLRPAGRPPPPNTSQLAGKPKDKAIVGFKQELKSLRVTPAEAIAVASGPTDGGRRKLRSQEATRFKSDLSQYFPEYDEVIGNDPKEEHILDINTPIILVESSAAHPATDSGRLYAESLRSNNTRHSTRHSVLSVPVRGYGDRLFHDVFDSHILDFTFLAAQHKGGKSTVDPLPDSYFEAHHKRAERLERSIRNTEKGRAQHEKDQILRLLEGLQGPDWLRIMGVSGITETKKKTFEPAREHFIRGCRTILEKFRLWGLEEKRRKTEKDRAHAEELRAREEATGEVAAPGRRGRGKAKGPRAAAAADKPKARRRKDPAAENAKLQQKLADDDDNDGDEAKDEDEGDDDDDDSSLPESSDFDAVITRQLHEEALARSRLAAGSDGDDDESSKAASTKRRKMGRIAVDNEDVNMPDELSSTSPEADDALSLKAPAPRREVKSFFQKRYQREAALSKDRRKGRTVMAWGQPVPEPKEVEFDLPDDILDKEDETAGDAISEEIRVDSVKSRGRGRGGARVGGRGGSRGGGRGAARGSTRGGARGGLRGGTRVGVRGSARGGTRGGRGGRPRKQ